MSMTKTMNTHSYENGQTDMEENKVTQPVSKEQSNKGRDKESRLGVPHNQ